MILVANGKVLATNYFIRDSVYDCYSFSAPMGDYIAEVDLVAEVGNLVRNGVVSLSPEQMREKRNQLLADSDWTQVADAPVNKAAWATYRHALRDMTSSADFPWDAVWPTSPDRVAEYYKDAMDSVNIINAGKPESMFDEAWTDCLRSNKENLNSLLAKNFWTTEDLTPLRDALNKEST